jgi:hypothetical protein
MAIVLATQMMWVHKYEVKRNKCSGTLGIALRIAPALFMRFRRGHLMQIAQSPVRQS